MTDVAGHGRRILVIDDEDMVRETITMMLEDQGYEIRGAPDGNKGLKLIESFQPDLVITDIIMPDKEGIETIVEIRRRWPEMRIIAISGGGRTSNLDFLQLARKFGANETLVKPFDPDEISSAVARVLGTSPNRKRPMN